jgi:phospholipid transport system substrate-binding protein
VIRWIAGVLLAALISAPSLAADSDLAPDALVKKVAEETLVIVRGDQDIRAGNRKKIFDLVDAKVLPYFNFAHMTQLAMGKNWRQATPAQQQTLTAEFRALLVNIYASAFTSYKNQTIDVKPLKLDPGATNVIVKSVINQPGGQQPVAVDYSMEKTADGWKVYDVTIEGVRMVMNYRNTFDGEVQKGGIDGLISTLQNKNKMLAQKGK